MKGHEPTTLEERVQRLEDIEAIKEIMHQYAHCADMCDPEGMIACFTDDCMAKYFTDDLSKGYEAPVFNKSETYDYLKQRLIDYVNSASHHISNEQIYFEKIDRAVAYMYMYSWQRFTSYPQQPDMHRWGRYEIFYVKEKDGEWRISNLQLLSAGEYNGTRIAEQFNRSWPPVPIQKINPFSVK
ncbi:nuclear transport factor 2 family protein [Bacillus sp. OK048]|uniref:nuclear transport factor 2 family protein n=1 Tax=Bacillus sp. OK048 TaxID=1882761 RepID=UPI001C313210|nr:nuclear transport factor 2 family protein [Bacillus sp. OK048]